MIPSNNNEESIALLDLFQADLLLQKISIWAFTRTELYSVKLMAILAEIFIYSLDFYDRGKYSIKV